MFKKIKKAFEGYFGESDKGKVLRPAMPSERDRAVELAERLGTGISLSISFELWSLPILEKMADRIEAIEDRLRPHYEKTLQQLPRDK